jgi:hypothetical protein
MQVLNPIAIGQEVPVHAPDVPRIDKWVRRPPLRIAVTEKVEQRVYSSGFDVVVSFKIILPVEEERNIWPKPYRKLQVATRSLGAVLRVAEPVPA